MPDQSRQLKSTNSLILQWLVTIVTASGEAGWTPKRICQRNFGWRIPWTAHNTAQYTVYSVVYCILYCILMIIIIVHNNYIVHSLIYIYSIQDTMYTELSGYIVDTAKQRRKPPIASHGWTASIWFLFGFIQFQPILNWIDWMEMFISKVGHIWTDRALFYLILFYYFISG